MRKPFLYLLITFLTSQALLFSEEEQTIKESLFSGIKARLIGPAITGGRISDFAVDPEDHKRFFVAVSGGNVWKTTNKGISFKPVFDSYGSYSIGCVTIDPNNPFTVWVGTGENNSQRSVGWGDGIYKSTDGGESWEHKGLKKSEHIAKIIVDPRNSDVIYVAAQGPLWGPGGDRGLYKSTDGGKSWELSLEISENTGVTDVVYDPRNPDVLYAASYQRRRHTWTLINGGPESAIYKSVDAGKTWNKINKGLPGVELGRIGLAISPVDPNVLYAIVEAAEDKSGFYRSTNRGATWQRRSDHVSSSPQYYQEIVCDPENVDLVYSLSTYTRYTEDGGKTWNRLSLKERHVDDHALWIDPSDNRHMMIGGDGGIYESYDKGKTWRFFENMPIVQFYRIQADNAEPFYNVYGGTQDNNSLGGPSRTTSANGLMNQDWIFVVGGDGYEPQIDPTNPDIIYGQWQYGNLVRFDKSSGEITGIKPIEDEGEELRWNWDTPLIISPHNHKRLYFAANKVFRSDDQGNSWTKISDDLTKQIDRNQLEVMGKVWSPEAVSKNASTSLYGNIVSLVESEITEDLIWVGTDDGLIHVTTNAGENWTKIENIQGVPELSYVADIYASRHDANTAYALFNNHKNNDFKPYIYKTTDLGKSWLNISNNLPENEPLWTIEEDTKNKNLLFVGTEFSLYFSINGGKKWMKFNNGLPTVAVRDLDIQERENDLVIGTFGRSIYVIDDYTPMSYLANDTNMIQKDAMIFPVKTALMFQEQTATGRRNAGETFYRAENPPYGATFSYYMKEGIKTKKDLRKENEKDLKEKDGKITYPSFDKLRQEDLEESPYILFVIKDMSEKIVRKLKASPKTGINRITWDLRLPTNSPLGENTNINNHSGIPCMPGKYTVEMHKSVDGRFTQITDPVEFEVKLLDNSHIKPEDQLALKEFRQDVDALYSVVNAANKKLAEMGNKIALIDKTIKSSEGIEPKMLEEVRDIELKMEEINKKLNGNQSISKRNANQTPSISDRIGYIIFTMWYTNDAPTQTNRESFEIASKQMKDILSEMKTIDTQDIKQIDNQLDQMNAPWTPGRFPKWNE